MPADLPANEALDTGTEPNGLQAGVGVEGEVGVGSEQTEMPEPAINEQRANVRQRISISTALPDAWHHLADVNLA